MKNKFYYPLFFFQAYLLVILLFYIFGPWNFSDINTAKTCSYLVISQIIICIGYIFGVESQKNIYRNYEVCSIEKLVGIRFVKQAILVNLLLFIPVSLSRTGEIFPDIFFGFLHSGNAYLNNYHRLENGNPFVFVEYIRSFLSPWIIGIFPVLIIYWESIVKLYKVLGIICIALNIFLYIATGTNKGIADFVITFPWFFVLYKITSKAGFEFKIKYALTFFSIFSIFIILFGMSMEGRGVVSPSYFSMGGRVFETNSTAFISSAPSFLLIIYYSLLRYLCQGYFALSLSFDLDYQSTFGFGNSTVLARNADRFFNTNFFENNSIPALLESQFGWSKEGLWHSIYPWLASDFGFLGALIVMGIFSFLFALTWCRVIAFKKPFEITLLYLLFILFYYIPANNQVFQSLETLVCFSICFIFLLWTMSFSKVKFFVRKKDKLY
jgi:hypothetical protein